MHSNLQSNQLHLILIIFQVIKYHELVPTVRDWRRIAAEYVDLQVYPYSDHTPFVSKKPNASKQKIF